MNNLLKDELSAKSFVLQNINNSSISIYNNIENNTTNQQSKDNQNLNEKIVKLFIGNHSLISMKTIKKLSYFYFINKYLKNELYYNSIIIDHIIHNDRGHIVAEFKDFLIIGDINEFLHKYYKKNESNILLPRISEYYISCSVIFPNYVILPESKYIYKNIQKKQKVIDMQQEQEEKEKYIHKGIIENEKEENLFNTQILDSILNQTDSSGIKQNFGIYSDENSIVGKLSKIIERIKFYEKNQLPKFKNCLYKKNNKIKFNNSFFKNNKIKKYNRMVNKERNNGNKEKEYKNINKISKSKRNKNTLEKKNIIQLSNTIKINNELTLNNLNKSNNKNNGSSLKNIIERNNNYSKTKNKKSIKSKEKIGRNWIVNLIQDNSHNYFHTTTNSSIGGFNNIINNNIIMNNKCKTSRDKYNKKYMRKNIKNNSKIKIRAIKEIFTNLKKIIAIQNL